MPINSWALASLSVYTQAIEVQCKKLPGAKKDLDACTLISP
jgi:hypothetical protein